MQLNPAQSRRLTFSDRGRSCASCRRRLSGSTAVGTALAGAQPVLDSDLLDVDRRQRAFGAASTRQGDCSSHSATSRRDPPSRKSAPGSPTDSEPNRAHSERPADSRSARRVGELALVAERSIKSANHADEPAPITCRNRPFTRERHNRDCPATDARRCVLGAVFDQNPVSHFVIDASGILLAVDAAGAEQLGYSDDELKHQSPFDRIFVDDRDVVRMGLARCLARPRKPPLVGGPQASQEWCADLGPRNRAGDELRERTADHCHRVGGRHRALRGRSRSGSSEPQS